MDVAFHAGSLRPSFLSDSHHWMFLDFRLRSYPVAFTSPSSFQSLTLSCAVLYGFGTDRAWNTERRSAIRRKGKVPSCALPGENRRMVMPRKPVVLCVDDEWNGLEGRKMLLEEAGRRVLIATSGAGALHLFASHPVDLV